MGGDSWDSAEIPLMEDFERYRIAILSRNGSVKRVMESETTSLLYTIADERADFGTTQTHLSIRIVQLSRIAGEGFAATAQCLIA